MYKGDLFLARRICKTIGHIYDAGVVENFNWDSVDYTRVKHTCIHCKEFYKFDKAEPLLKYNYSEKQKHDAFEWLREYAIENNSSKAICILTEILRLHKTISGMEDIITAIENNGDNEIAKQLIKSLRKYTTELKALAENNGDSE